MAVKILALHGYAQSGPGFRRKLRKLQSHLEKIFPGIQICCPTGLIRLLPCQETQDAMPRRPESPGSNDEPEPEDEPDPYDIDAYGWHTLDNTCDPPMGFVDSLDALANILKKEGPFDGILGFSQGALMAVMTASLLEGELRRKAFERAREDFPDSFPYPPSFEILHHPPLKFGITYGTLMGRGKKYTAFYNNPRIQTPFLHFCGNWDIIVEIGMARAVEDAQIGADRCIRITHPGAHIVSVGAEHFNAVSNFIAYHALGSEMTDFSRPILERQLTLRLPLRSVETAIEKFRSGSIPSSSDQSDLSCTFSPTEPKKIGLRRFSRCKTTRIPRRATFESAIANSDQRIAVELQIFPSPKNPFASPRSGMSKGEGEHNSRRS